MYIGETGPAGLMHLVWEMVDNAVDEATAGFATNVDVVLHPDGSVQVSDNGRGIPVGEHPGTPGVTALEVVFTELHAGGKFGGGAYGASGGLHGVGASVVNALSKRLDAEVRRDSTFWSLSFSAQQAGHFDGKAFTPGHDLRSKPARGKATGTKVRFWPDLDLFDEGAVIDAAAIAARLRLTCYLVRNLKVTVADRRPDGEEPFEFMSRGGLADLVAERSAARKTITSIVTLQGSDTFIEKIPRDGKIAEVERELHFEAALAWNTGFETDITSYVNIIPTPSGGTHLAGFEKSLTKAVNNILIKDSRKLARLKATENHRAKQDDVQEGLVAAVRISLPEPQFRGQTKQHLGTPQAETIVARLTYEQIKAWFLPGGGPRSHVKATGDKITAAILNRHAAHQLKETRRKAAKAGSGNLPPKLADCRVHGPDAELLLVEGDSAAGPAKRGRDARTMAVLPLRGKIVNAAKSSTKQVLDNIEAQAIFASVGAGAGPEFDLASTRYGRIVILCDADVDGSHIRCLLLTLIHRYMRPMLEAGRIYTAEPPLYTAKTKTGTLRAWSEPERDRLAKTVRGTVKWQRFKGLGEMNTDELRHCALDPATRTLKRLTMSDAEEAAKTAEILEVLMGSDVARRREYLTTHSALMDRAALDV